MKRRIVVLLLALSFAFTGCSQMQGDEGEMKKATSEVNSDLEVHFLDVGQGDCTLIKDGEHAMLIDAGNNDKGTKVQAYLQSQGVEKLDYIIGTHPDADHIGGLDVVIYKFEEEMILMPDVSKDTKTYRDVIDSAKAKSETITVPQVGDTYTLGDAEFTILSPGGEDYDSVNDYSIGIMLEHGENRFLFTGDAEEEAEEEMTESKIDLNADVYKVSHHGSRTASTEEFLDEVSPEYAVISCGEGNSYGHPHAEVLNRLREKKVRVFRTDEQGTIVVSSDGKKITWNMSASDSWTVGESDGKTVSDAEPMEKSQDSQKKRNFIINTNTKKFHLLECASVKSMKDENKEERKETEEQLEKEGYEPCGNCIGKQD